MRTKSSRVLNVFIFFMIITSLVFPNLVFAENVINPEGPPRTETLEGNPNCTNKGLIETSDDDVHGMYVKEGGRALNLGTVITEGWDAYGMYAEDNSAAENIGRIVTKGEHALGMYAEWNSEATNSGSITTKGEDACGMCARYYSIATNNNIGSIATENDWAEGMYAEWDSEATNSGRIITKGMEAYGMHARYYSAAANAGEIRTSGPRAHGMYAYGPGVGVSKSYPTVAESNTTAEYNTKIANSGSIITEGTAACGMVATQACEATNSGSIITEGDGAAGMIAADLLLMPQPRSSQATVKGESYIVMIEPSNSIIAASQTDRGNIMSADYISRATNTGSIITEGDGAAGMIAAGLPPMPQLRSSQATVKGESYLTEASGSYIENKGSITTLGEGAHGMVALIASEARNEGTITVTGTGSDAVYVVNSIFTNSGNLNSLRGNAITAFDSSVTLFGETVLASSHDIVGDETSSLSVEMNENLSARVKGFENFTKSGKGTFQVEGGSYSGNVCNKEGTFKIEKGTQFVAEKFTQEDRATLNIFANSNSATDHSAIPLWVKTHASVSGDLVIDMSTAMQPGLYRFIGTNTYDDNFNTYFVNNPYYIPYEIGWISGSSLQYYSAWLGYSFSEQALGLVAAIEDWSLLRWIMANHLQDVMGEMDKFNPGEKVFYSHFFGNKTDRDPAGSSPLGFEAKTKGLSIGFDQKVNDTTLWGMYAGYTEKDIDFTDVFPASSDWEEQNTWYLGAYMSKRFDQWVISDTLTYRSTDHDSFRRQIDGDARASFDSWAITNDIRVGYMMSEIGENSKWEIAPEVGINVGYFERDGYRESNGYTYGDYDTTVVEGLIGVRLKGEYLSGDGSRFVPRLRLSYVKVISGDDVTIDQTWYGNTKWFTEELDDYYFVTDLGLSLYRSNGFGMSLNYTGRFGDNSDSHGGWLRLDWKL